MSGNNGGPWGSGGSGSGGDNRGGDNRGGGKRPGEGPQIPEIEELMKKGTEQLRVLMGGRGSINRGNGGGGSGPAGPMLTRRNVGFGVLALIALWLYASVYQVKPEERSVELTFGKFSGIGESGLNFAPWPIVSAEIVPVSREQTAEIGNDQGGRTNSGLMLTRDEAIVDIKFQVIYNVSDPANYLFNLGDAAETVRAVSESAMRDIIARSELSPILNRDRGAIGVDLIQAIQETLDTYNAGINVIRVNLERANPPQEVNESFIAVQSARQDRDRLEREADAYANTVLAGARGQAAALQEQAEAYRAEVVNNAQGEASRFQAIYAEYQKAPEVTRKRMYLESMEAVLGSMNKVILDGVSGTSGQGVLPYLPLSPLRPLAPAGTAAADPTSASTTGGN